MKITEIYLDFRFDGDQYLQVFAIENEEVVGTARVECWAKGAGYHPFVSKVWVKPERRREGIGRKIMEYIIQKAVENGNKSLALYVHNDNLSARHLYEKLGFFAATGDADMQILYAKNLTQINQPPIKDHKNLFRKLKNFWTHPGNDHLLPEIVAEVMALNLDENSEEQTGYE